MEPELLEVVHLSDLLLSHGLQVLVEFLNARDHDVD